MEDIDIKDTNMAGVGGDADKEQRKKCAKSEPAWQVAGKEPGVQVWRIENFEVVAWPKEKYGQWHTGDSYIVMSTQKDERKKLQWHVFFWLGDETSLDEQGTAAYKTVELCDLFDGRPTQSREVQGQESSHFRTLFPKIRYLAGGVPTGLKHVITDCFEAKLFHIRKTKKGVIEKEVNLERDSLNDGDCFVLDAGKRIYIFHGSEASPMEKYEANASAERIESQRQGQSSACIELDNEFWRLLGGKGPIKSAAEATDDIRDVDRGMGILYKITDESGQLEMFEVARRQFRRTMLDTNDVMMLDHGDEVCIWVGIKASKQETRDALGTAMNYLRQNKRNMKTPIHMYKEGQEIKNKIWNKAFAN